MENICGRGKGESTLNGGVEVGEEGDDLRRGCSK